MEKRNCQVNEKNHHISEDLEAEKLTCAPRTWEGKEGGSQYKEELSNRQTTHDGVVSSGRPGFLAALQEMLQREGESEAERPAQSVAGCGTMHRLLNISESQVPHLWGTPWA